MIIKRICTFQNEMKNRLQKTAFFVKKNVLTEQNIIGFRKVAKVALIVYIFKGNVCTVYANDRYEGMTTKDAILKRLQEISQKRLLQKQVQKAALAKIESVKNLFFIGYVASTTIAASSAILANFKLFQPYRNKLVAISVASNSLSVVFALAEGGKTNEINAMIDSFNKN
jgi:hypothetical protein